MRLFTRRARRAAAASRAEAANYKAREYLREKRAALLTQPVRDINEADGEMLAVLVTVDYLLSGRGEGT